MSKTIGYNVDADGVALLTFDLPCPRCSISEYDRAIELVEFEVKDEMVITESRFRAWVGNQWTWTEQFTNSNMAYSSKLGGR